MEESSKIALFLQSKRWMQSWKWKLHTWLLARETTDPKFSRVALFCYQWQTILYRFCEFWRFDCALSLTAFCSSFHTIHLFKWLWKYASKLGHKIFFWLLLHDRINTSNLLKRKSMHLDCYDCVFCNKKSEEITIDLFYDCRFSTNVSQRWEKTTKITMELGEMWRRLLL